MTTTGLGAISSGAHFEGFADADFDAYTRKKWSSNAYTLERRRTKDKLIDLGRSIAERMELGNKALELGASDESPTVANGRKVDLQAVYFTRSAELRSRLRPRLNRTDLQSGAGLFDIALQHQHACILLKVDVEGFSVGLEIAGKATVDRENFASKLGHAWAQEGLAKRLGSMEVGTLVGFGNACQPLQAPVDWAAWLERAKNSEESFVVEKRFPRDTVGLGTTTFVDIALAALQPIAEVFFFIAWTPENDFSRPKADDEGERQVKASRGFEAGDRVTILSGLFAGRGGYLGEIDSKGKAKVMVGPVGVNVDLKDLKRAE
jgi:hypothetical protein